MILFSPSQLKTYRACTRKWALEKIAGLRGPETKSQALGKDVDDNYLQPYLRDGKPIDESTLAGQIAASGIAWLPQPKWKGLEVQKHFVFASPSKLPFGYQGYKDLWLPYGGQPGFNNELPVVGDFKTTKSIKKWALKEDALRSDEQSVIYSVNAILETKSEEINLSWLYLQTEGTRTALPTQITVHTNEVAEQFKGIEADAKEMYRLRTAAPIECEKDVELAKQYALSLPGNKDSCGDYGGCPHQHICFKLEDLFDVPTENLVREHRSEEVMGETIDLFAQLQEKQQQAAAPAPTAPPTQDQIAAEPPLPVNPPMPEGTPLAPPLGAAPAKAKRGRPKKTDIVSSEAPPATGEVSSAAPVAGPGDDAVDGDLFFVAWMKLGSALKGFLDVIGAVK